MAGSNARYRRVCAVSSTATSNLPAAAMARSSSDIAAATQRPPAWEMAPVNAVTRPPEPRLAVTSPSSERENDTGPRFDATRICLAVGSRSGTGIPPSGDQRGKGADVVLQLARGEEAIADRLPSGAAQVGPFRRVAEQPEEPLRASVDGVHQEPAHAVLDLQPDASDVPADHRPLLPQRLGHHQPEPFAQRLLDDHG